MSWLMPALDDAGFTYGHPGGAFYIYTNVSSSGLPSPEFCLRLLEETGVMLFPGTMFGDEEARHVRVSYLQPVERIREAVDRMGRFMDRARAA